MRTDYYVYMLFRNDGRPFYVGKGSGKRWLRYQQKNAKHNNPHLNAILKQENYCFPKLKVAKGLTEEEAHATEMIIIAALGRRCAGTGELVNLTVGGEGVSGLVWSEESRKKASISGKNKKFTEEQKAEFREKLRASWTPERREAWSKAAAERWLDPDYRVRVNRGEYTLSEDHKAAIAKALSTPEHRARMSAWATGRVHSDESRKKRSVAHKGKKLSDEHKAKIGDAHRGKPSWLKKGDNLTEEHKAAISAGKKGKSNGLEGKTLSDAHKAACSAARKAVIARKAAAGIPDLSGRGRRAKYERMLAEQEIR